MASANKTKILNLPQYLGNEYMQRQDWNEAFISIESAIADITYLMDNYGYTWSMSEADTGALTITVTIGADCPQTATMTAVITEAENGDTTIDVTTVIDGVTSKSSHTINDNGGEGGVVHG